jgi:hypothetical protein
MNSTATTAVIVSAALLAAWIIYRQFRRFRPLTLIAHFAALALYLAVLHWTFGFPSVAGAESKSGETDALVFPAIVLYMYVAMVLGMICEYVYHYLDGAPGDRHFELGSLIKPVLVSPLVFIPLASSLQAANLDLTFGIPRVMLFLVAFENGFLWRGYFSRKMSGAEAPASIKPRAAAANASAANG